MICQKSPLDNDAKWFGCKAGSQDAENARISTFVDIEVTDSETCVSLGGKIEGTGQHSIMDFTVLRAGRSWLPQNVVSPC